MRNLNKYMVYVVLYLFIIMCGAFFFQNNVLATSVYVKGNTRVRLHGWISSAFYYERKIGKKSNTSYKGKQNKWNYISRAFTRLGFTFTNSQNHTMANITIDSWPKNFNLMLAYVKQSLGSGYYMIAGKDWSIIKQHTFYAFCFEPHPVGFQGSQRWYPQLQFGKNVNLESFSLTPKIAFEDRYNNNGVITGKNMTSKNATPTSNSDITIARKSLPAIAVSLSSKFHNSFGKPFEAYAFFEVQPIYLFYDGMEHRKNPYVWGAGINIPILNRTTIISEYIHTSGMSGIAGIMGNNLKTYSYIYYKKNLIKRTSDAFNIETYSALTHKIDISFGFDYVHFSNKNYNNSLFLKNEVKKAATTFLLLKYKTTKVNTIYLGYRNIKTKYAISNLNDRFETSVGNELWVGYRYYF